MKSFKDHLSEASISGSTWYRGQEGKWKGNRQKPPIFFTTSEYASGWFALNSSNKESDAVVVEAKIKAKNPANYEIMMKVVKELGVTERDIFDHSVYDGTNHTDFLYVPAVRQRLQELGYDSWLDWDTFMNDSIKALVLFDPKQIKVTKQRENFTWDDIDDWDMH